VAEPIRLLLVCLGNICRSPMAEGVLRERFQREGLADRVELDSAGTGPWHVGRPPDPRAIRSAADHGIDISRLRGRQVDARDFDRFDWLLCADRSNLSDLRAIAPDEGARRRVALLLDWSGAQPGGEIPDPYTGGPEHFEHVWELLRQAADGAVRRLRDELRARR